MTGAGVSVADERVAGRPSRGAGARWPRQIASTFAQALLVAFVVVTVAFLLVRLVPGDPARAVLGPRASPQAVAALRHEMHLDHPITVEYVTYLDQLAHGSLGDSIVQNGQPVSRIISQTLPVTLELIFATMILSVLVGIPVGLASALTRRPAVDHGARAGLVTLLATPPFFFGLLLILVFALEFPVLPAGGWAGTWPANLSYLVLPAIALSAYLMPLIARTVRQVALDTEQQDFVEAAIARGLPRRTIVRSHILPNSLLPVVTLLGINVGALIAGAVVVESVFGMPGIGSELVQSVSQRDYPVIEGIAVVSALVVVLSNAVADTAYALVEPENQARMIEAEPTAALEDVGRRPGRTRRRSLIVGAVLLGTIAALCVVIPMVWPDSPNALVAQPYQPPSLRHPFGTDSVGRDLFVRVFAGGRIDLVVATFMVGTSLILGTLLGTVAGSSRWRAPDLVLMRLVDALIAFPYVILILVLVVLIGPGRAIGPAPAGLPATVIAFLVVGWAYYARLARAQTLALRNSDYIVATEILGYSRARIVLRHLSPSVLRVTAAYAVGDAILAVVLIASLAFLGAGVQPPTPEWGSIMYEGRAFLGTSWWITVAPGVMLALTGLGLSLVADALLSDRRGGR